MGAGTSVTTPHGAFATADGYIVIGAATDETFGRLATTLGPPLTEERFATQAGRLAHRDELIQQAVDKIRMVDPWHNLGIVMADGAYIRAVDLGLAEPPVRRALTLADAREEAERNCLLSALLAHGNRSNEVAEELDISRITLYRLRMRHGLQDLAGLMPPDLLERRK